MDSTLYHTTALLWSRPHWPAWQPYDSHMAQLPKVPTLENWFSVWCGGDRACRRWSLSAPVPERIQTGVVWRCRSLQEVESEGTGPWKCGGDGARGGGHLSPKGFWLVLHRAWVLARAGCFKPKPAHRQAQLFRMQPRHFPLSLHTMMPPESPVQMLGPILLMRQTHPFSFCLNSASNILLQ